MNARVNDYRMLWHAAVTSANPRLSALARWAIPLLVTTIGLLVWYTEGPRAALVWVWCSVCATLLLTWTWRFLPGAVKLNSPADAKLVPTMRRRLVELTCLVWFAGIAGLVIAPYPETVSPGLWMPWAVVLTLGCGFGVAGHKAASALVCTACFGSAFLGKLPQSVHDMLSTAPVLAMSLLLYAGLAIVAARAIFPEAGEGHWRMIAARARMGGSADKTDPMVEKLAGAYTRGWYAAALRRNSAARDRRRLLQHALGPAHHPGEQLVGLALLSGILVIVGVFITWRTGADVLAGIGWILALATLIIPIAAILRMNVLVAARPGEQALVRLAPAMPGTAPSFNRCMGRGLLRQAVLAWGAGAGAALLLAALGGADASILLRMACICCLVLPLAAAPLRNHAVRAPLSAVMPVLLLAVSIAASIGIGYAARTVGELPVLPVAALASIAIAAWAIARGLRVMEGSPFAFPAGRMD